MVQTHKTLIPSYVTGPNHYQCEECWNCDKFSGPG